MSLLNNNNNDEDPAYLKNNKISAPIPIKEQNKAYNHPLEHESLPSQAHSCNNDLNNVPHEAFLRPSTATSFRRVQQRRPSYSTIELSREAHYHLDYPEDLDEIEKLHFDPASKYFARLRPRTLNLPKLLPYKIEPPKDRVKFLSHIISHLYIAIKSLDIQGSLSITAKDLASIKEISDLSDIDLALETNLFEFNNSQSQGTEEFDEADNYFAYEELAGSDSDLEEDEDEEEDEEGDEDTTSDSAAQHKKTPKSAAVVGVRIWTHELLVWLKMKYDMPVSLRISLARVYYSICLCRGQHINLKTYVNAFELLTKDSQLLKDHGLKLAWVSLYKELENHFPKVDASLDAFEKKDHRQLLRLAERASCFFDKESLPEIFAKLGSKFSIANASLVLSSMSMLPMTFTPEGLTSIYDIRHYIESIFYIWKKLSKSSGIDSHLTSRIGTIAMMSLAELNDVKTHEYLRLGKSGVFTDDQMCYLIKVLLNSLSIMNEKYGSMNPKFYHGFASAIIFSMNGSVCLEENGLINQLKILVNAIESYVHPSNTGEWTRPISKLILSLVYQFHKRFNMEKEEDGALHNIPKEYSLHEKVIDEFVEIFLPVIRTGVQSKRSNAADDYLSCLNLLAHLRPHTVLEYVILDIYESLQGVISTHRVIIALRTVEELSRYIASTPIFRVHLTRIMSLAVLGIDSNDLEKTVHTLNTFSTIANFVPFHDLTDGNGDTGLAIQFTEEHLEYLQRKIYGIEAEQHEFTISNDLEVEALKSSSFAFKELMKTLSHRIFTLLENIPDPSKSTGIEKGLCESLPKFLFVIFESLSDDIFKDFRKNFIEFIFNNSFHTIADVVGGICGGLIKREPSYLKVLAPQLMERIRDEITENGAGVSRTGIEIVPRDQLLFWYLVILNECLGNGGGHVVAIGKELNEFSFYVMEHVKGPAVFSSAYLLNQILQATTKIKLAESRLIPPSYETEHGVDENCWGGFQFDESRFSDDALTFGWFIPTEREIKYAVETFKSHVMKNLDNILQLMKQYSSEDIKDATKSIKIGDELRMNFLYLSYAISGISFLLDPSFDEDIPKLNQHQTETIQERLILLNQIRSSKNSKSTRKDESHLDNLHENLQQIVNDIGNDELIDYAMDFEKLENVDISGDQRTGLKQDEHEVTLDRMEIDGENSSKSQKSLKGAKPDVIDTVPDESARATPSIEGIDMSTMNPGITFRERRLYTSRYYFGDDIETRRSNKYYSQIHKTRHLIGKSMHLIGKFMTAHFHDNTKLFKHYLYVLNIWFSDVGRERVLEDSHAKISSGYVGTIQHINRVRKPYTRILFGSRIESYHLLRVALHSTSRTQTDLDKLLLEDVVKLSFSNYATISSAAQATLVDAMKRLNGSYNILTNLSFKYLSKALDENNVKMIESGLNVFGLKRIKNKLKNDYFNLKKYIELLHRCLTIDNIEVNEIAQKLFEGIYTSITLPSSICLIDHKEIDCIRPPDEFIDLEIKAVRLAKEKKRKIYLDKVAKLEESIVFNEKHNNHWKIASLNLCLLIDLQHDLQMPISNDVFQILAKQASSDHPIISRLALKGISKLVNKLYILQLFNYKLSDAYDFSVVPKDFKVIDTSHSFSKDWEAEIQNTSHPNYFIDHKANTGWLFWDDKMLTVTNSPCHDLALNESDSLCLKAFSDVVTKSWFLNIVKLWINDNEATSAFQGTDVFLTSTIVLLISNGYVQHFSFKDLLDIIQEVYIPDDKGTHIVTCELIAGILVGSKTINPSFAKERDSFICLFLKNILDNDLSPDNSGVWNIFSWWIPAHIDCRRFPEITNIITSFKINSESDSAIKEATRLGYIRSFIAAVTWTYPSPDSILKMCFENINNRYQATRDQVGSLIAITSFTYFTDSVDNGEEFASICNFDSGLELYNKSKKTTLLEMVPSLFEKVEKWRLEVQYLLPQEILKTDYIYSATTILTWLRQALNTSIAILYQDSVDSHIVPFLLKLINMKDVCQLGNIDPITPFKKVSQIPFNSVSLNKIVLMLERYSKEDLNVIQSIILGEFTETVYFKNLLSFNQFQREQIVKITNDLTYHKNVQVRESEASTLSGLIHTYPPEEVESLVKKYIEIYSKDLDKIRKKNRKTQFRNLSNEDIRILHGATLGLGALVHAFPFASPPPKWVPDVLSILANKASGISGVVGKTAKETLGKFKKNRQDSWHIDSKVFSEAQIQEMEGVLWKSYFI